MTTNKKIAADNAPEGLALSDSETVDARKEGAKEAEKETAKDAYKLLTDGQTPGEAPVQRWLGSEEIQREAVYLEYGVDEFEELVADKGRLPEEKAAGLLALERAGQNRTPYVKALMKRLGVKSPYEVTTAGPDYTNDVQPVSKL